MAGPHWLKSFLEHQTQLSIRQSEGVVSLTNLTGKVIATKGARVVHSLSSSGKEELMSVIGCCNAVVTFIPPVVIIKDVNKKPEFLDGLPAGSEV
ncbi:hypothetical protein JTB14_010621 [Gonioctena quinquepunctata]|nr:hypothetical protein JTB14_010621 [Gonioctena quinquepunctata]